MKATADAPGRAEIIASREVVFAAHAQRATSWRAQWSNRSNSVSVGVASNWC